MKRGMTLIALLLACVLMLSACGCSHETWLDADCVNPKRCEACGETEGAPLGHSWLAATCETPKTCENCGETEGEALGHKWIAASCEAPEMCETCGLTQGEALAHDWVEATTEEAAHCTICGLSQGSCIVTDERFSTAATIDLQGKWSFLVALTGDMIGVDDFNGELEMELILDFGNDGTMTMTAGIPDEEKFLSEMTNYTIEKLYAELAASGYDKDAANELMQQTYGKSVEEYAEEAMGQLDLEALLADMSYTGVYYVEDGTLFSASSWEDDMEEMTFTIDGDTLILDEDLTDSGKETSELKRIVEE